MSEIQDTEETNMEKNSEKHYYMETSEIPTEIIVSEVLPKLHIKSFLRFKCVSKFFRTVISSRKFIDLHLRSSQLSNTNNLLILVESDRDLYSLDLDNSESSLIKFPLPSPYKTSVRCSILHIDGSCNGLLSFQAGDHFSYSFSMVLNPSTGTYRLICPCLLGIAAFGFGFGYDHGNDDYKIVRFGDYCFDERAPKFVNLYSLKANSWRSVEKKVPECILVGRETGVLIDNHLLHWRFWYKSEKKCRIGCFNLCTEQWEDDIPFPDLSGSNSTSSSKKYHQYLKTQNRSNNPVYIDLGVLNGHLCISRVTANNFSSASVWVMKEYGSKGSWVKMFNTSDSTITWMLQDTPLGFSEGEILLGNLIPDTDRHELSDLMWYNTKDRTTKRIEIHKGCASRLVAYTCKASAVAIPGGHLIRPEESKPKEAEVMVVLSLHGNY